VKHECSTCSNTNANTYNLNLDHFCQQVYFLDMIFITYSNKMEGSKRNETLKSQIRATVCFSQRKSMKRMQSVYCFSYLTRISCYIESFFKWISISYYV